jgi:hypothetical protein
MDSPASDRQRKAISNYDGAKVFDAAARGTATSPEPWSENFCNLGAMFLRKITKA